MARGRLSGSTISTLLIELGADVSVAAKEALLQGGQTILADARPVYTVLVVHCRQVASLRSMQKARSLELYLMHRVLLRLTPLGVICTEK